GMLLQLGTRGTGARSNKRVDSLAPMKLGQKARVAIFAVVVIVVLLFRPARAHVRAATLLEQFGAPDRSAPFAVDETRSEIPGARGAIRVRTFTPRGRTGEPGLVMVHGVHHLGIEEPRLIRFARAIAAS